MGDTAEKRLQHVLARFNAYGLNAGPSGADDGVHVTTCPTHRDRRVTFDVDELGIWIDHCPSGCLPLEIARAVQIDAGRAGVHSYVAPGQRTGLLEAAERSRQRHAAAVAGNGSGGRLGHTPEEIHRALVDLLAKDHAHPKRRNRFTCPACGDERHGGLKVDLVGDAVLLHCFGRCGATDEILTALALTFADLRPPLPDVGFEPVAGPTRTETPAEDPPIAAAVAAERSSWTPVDLTDVLAGKRTRVVPELGHRSDGVRLLYRGKEHSIAGEPESGKTWWVLLIVADVLIGGGRVVYVDFEDDEWTVVERLLALGVLPSRLANDGGQFRYVRPEERHTPEQLIELLTFDEFDGVRADLMALDGVTEGMGLYGLQPAGGGQIDAAAWRRVLIRPALNLGVATVATDHVVKDDTRRGRYAIGDQHKLAGLTGTQWMLEQVDPFGRGLKGRSRVLVSKDRNGGLRQHGRPTERPGITYMGELVADAVSGELTSLVFWAPRDEDGDAAGAAVAKVIATLNELEVPPRAGRDACRAALTVAGFKIGNDILTEAVRVRKIPIAPEKLSADSDQQQLSAEDPDS